MKTIDLKQKYPNLLEIVKQQNSGGFREAIARLEAERNGGTLLPYVKK